MLTEVYVTGYQSLRKARLALGRFTVITGPTGSGKSAVIRAVRHVAFNSRGTSYFTRGQGVCAVAVTGADQEAWSVVLTRHSVSAKDSYQVITAPQEEPGAATAEYTKLGGKVPQEVSDVLQLGEINFAAQFGSPFLLSDSAGDVAKVLGRLTNVTMLFEAARECAVRKARIAARLKARQEDLSRLRLDAQRFRDLPARRKSVAAAEEALQAAQELASQAARLASGIRMGEAAQARLDAVKAVIAEVPDDAPLTALVTRRDRLAYLLGEGIRQMLAAEAASAEVGHYREAAQEQQAALEDLLVRAGKCPTCGQEIHRGRHDGAARGD